MANKHLYILPRGLYRGVNIGEINKTIDGLREMDLYRFPYDQDVYVQIAAADCISHNGQHVNNPSAWVLVGPYGNGEFFPEVVVLNQANRFSHVLSADPRVDKAEIRKIITVAGNLLIALLATRNIIKSTKENKLAKLGIGLKNPLKRFAYTTTISISANLEDHESVQQGSPKAPHYRGGHIRRQHFGPGRAFVKKIWIAPVIVNADPDFVNQRAAYNVSVAR